MVTSEIQIIFKHVATYNWLTINERYNTIITRHSELTSGVSYQSLKQACHSKISG